MHIDTAKMSASKELLPELIAFTGRWRHCTQCRIGELAKNKVFYRGTIPCDVLLLGEAPGKTEDEEGFPFVGASGELLETWLQILQPLRCAITNVVCCRPTDYRHGPNRAPAVSEAQRCTKRLREFVRLATPKAAVFLGKAADTYGRLLYPHSEIPMLTLPHPAFVLRKGGVESTECKQAIEKLKTFVLALHKYESTSQEQQQRTAAADGTSNNVLYEDTVALADLLLDDEGYEWAWNTIEAIRKTLHKTGTTTPAQRRALLNIRDSRKKE